MPTGAYGSRQLHLHDDVEGDMGALSKEELSRRRPEVRLINTFAVIRTYVLMGLKGIGALVLLWATVVLLGGFVSSLKKKDFKYISFIAFVQAAGMFNAVFDNQLNPLMLWFFLAMTKFQSLGSSKSKHNHGNARQRQTSSVGHAWSWLKRIITLVISKVTSLIVFVGLYSVLAFCLYGPLICAGLSYWRLKQPDYGSGNTDASQANLKPGMDLFYYLCIVQGGLFLIFMPIEIIGTVFLVRMVSRQVRLSNEVVFKYCIRTKLKYFENLASSDENWNFITYGTALLDSEIPEDNVSGARLLSALIEQGIAVRRQLLRSPRQRIQKLIGTLAWTSPTEGEMRWLAARIVEHVAHELSLAHFPGALECVSSLLDTAGDQEAVNFVAQLILEKQQGKRKVNLLSLMNLILIGIGKDSKNGGTSAKGTNEDLILQGLGILENLALDQQNCKVICSSDALFSKIVAPMSSKDFIEDIKTNIVWTKVTEGSLRLVSQLMRSPGDTGERIRDKVAGNIDAVKNLDHVLDLEINNCNTMLLQIRAIEILEQLWSGESTSGNWDRVGTRKKLKMKVLHFFLTDEWMEDYLQNTRAKIEEDLDSQFGKSNKSKKNQQARQALVENKMKAHWDAVRQLKEKAGDALATLHMENKIDSDHIRTFTECADVVDYLTKMLDPKNRTIRCRYSAAVILRHLCTHCTTLDENYIKETTLDKVLRELLQIKTESQATGTTNPTQYKPSISQCGNDIENQRGVSHEEGADVPRHKQQLEERMLQVALLLLCKAIRGKWINESDFAHMVSQLISGRGLAERLTKMVEMNRYATVSCLATVKLTCEMVTALIPYDRDVEDIKMKKKIVESLCQASHRMSGLESCMLFAGADRDCYGLPVKPFYSHLVSKAQDRLSEKEK